METEPAIPWARVAAFVRQHTHDVRNGLNSVDLETGILEEFVTEEEGRESLQRLRRQIRTLAEHLRTLAGNFQDPVPVTVPIAARQLFLLWREKHAGLPRAPEVQWADELGDERVRVDVEMMGTVFRELLINAVAFSAHEMVKASARAHAGSVIFELEEPKKGELDPSAWGEPFSTTRRDGYGLGLWTAQRLLEAMGAKFVQRYVREKSVLTTQVILAET